MQSIKILKNMTVFGCQFKEGFEIINDGNSSLTLKKEYEDGSGQSYCVQPELCDSTPEEFMKEVERINTDPTIVSEVFPEPIFDSGLGGTYFNMEDIMQLSEPNFDDAKKIASEYAFKLSVPGKTQQDIANDLENMLRDYANLKISESMAALVATAASDMLSCSREEVINKMTSTLSGLPGIESLTDKIPKEPSLQVKPEIIKEPKINGHDVFGNTKKENDSDEPNNPQA